MAMDWQTQFYMKMKLHKQVVLKYTKAMQQKGKICVKGDFFFYAGKNRYQTFAELLILWKRILFVERNSAYDVQQYDSCKIVTMINTGQICIISEVLEWCLLSALLGTYM